MKVMPLNILLFYRTVFLLKCFLDNNYRIYIFAIGQPEEVGGSIPVMPEEFQSMLYIPKDNEWPKCGRDNEIERISHGLSEIMEISAAEHFLAPVDATLFPVYYMVIEYPIDLSTIKARLDNSFYRWVRKVMGIYNFAVTFRISM